MPRERLQVTSSSIAGRRSARNVTAPAAATVPLDVADEGAGFAGDPEHAILRRPRGDGHGIGLALARELAHAEGGRIVVTSAGPAPVLTLLLPRPDAASHNPDDSDRN